MVPQRRAAPVSKEECWEKTEREETARRWCAAGRFRLMVWFVLGLK